MDISQVAYDVLAVLLPVVALALAEWIRRLIGNERLARIKQELEAKQELAGIAVSFVQQVYKDLDGNDKLLKAIFWLEEMLGDRGIKFSEEELRGLIESSLRAFKDVFGEEWGK